MNLELVALAGIPEVADGDDLAELIVTAAEANGVQIDGGDVVVVAQKIVSKAEGRSVDPSTITPTSKAMDLAAQTGKDPRLVQLILDESNEVLRATEGVIIVETRHGFVCANAGIDASNVPGDDLLLLPIDPDASAKTIRGGLGARLGVSPAVIVTDSFGRAWRSGQADVAIGCAGIAPLLDMTGTSDSHGRELTATITAVADEMAAAADLARRKADGLPVVVVRGRPDLVIEQPGPGAVAGLRERSSDLFR